MQYDTHTHARFTLCPAAAAVRMYNNIYQV